jgi:type I restriction enzyme S subunit
LSVTKLGVVPQLESAAKTDDGDNRKIVRRGDFVINGRSDRKGSSGVSEMDGSVSLINIIVKLREVFYPRFAHHLFRSSVFQEEFYRWGKGIVADLWSTNYWDFKRIIGAMPPLDEQKAIASYLDKTLAVIDSAISTQESMIRLLKERRSATITQAVTKGLDNNVRFKKSGNAWLGHVPTHWQVKRLRHLVRFNASNVDKKTVEGESLVRLCNYTDVYYNERIVLGPEYMVASASLEQIRKLCLRVGDVIITKDSEGPDDIGIPSLVCETAPDLVCGYHLALLRPIDHRLGPFIARSIASRVSKAYFYVNAKGVTRYALGYHAIADLPLVLPPLEEAQAISAYIDKRLSKLDSAIVSQERMIEVLKERRSAIITQAVTGQIDVR